MKEQGFTLVELAIVLVILGLLTGGILAGQSLVRASELRAVTTEYDRWLTATRAFRGKYLGLPGDLPNGFAFFGTTGSCTNAQAGTDPAGCNGDGNGIVDNNAERFRYWQQLALAGLIEGVYTGLTGSGGPSHIELGVNAPVSKVSKAGWALLFSRLYAHGSSPYKWTGGDALVDKQKFMLGAGDNNLNPYRPAFRPEEAWNIDVKLDDGMPGMGRVTAIGANSVPCATSYDVPTANYLLDEPSLRCALLLLLK